MIYSYPTDVSKYASFMTIIHLKNEGITTSQLQNLDDNVYQTTVGNVIALPMPTEISDSSGMRWVDESDQSIVGMGAEKTKALVGTIYSETAKRTGKNIEKHSALIFDGVEVKTYTFNWKMIPMNRNDSINIQKIVQELKLYSLPTITADAIFNFPDVFKVKFKGKHAFNGFKMLPSVLSQVNVSYGDGNSFFVYENGYANEVNLSLTFSEITSRNQSIQKRYS